MQDRYITQKELAVFCGCEQPYIAKLKKKGLFNQCLENGKFLRVKATEIAKIYEDSKDPSRDNQREANKKHKISPAKIDIQENTSANIKNTELYNQDNLNDLESLLLGNATSSQKVQIIKDFWAGKINQQKYLEGENLLIPKEQIVKDVQRILKAFRDKALALPTKISSDLVGLTEKKDVAVVVESYMYELLEELSSLEDIE